MYMIQGRGRIATVKATGERFLVQQRDLEGRKVHVHGHVTSFEEHVARYDGSKVFTEDAVTVEDVLVTAVLLDELFQQTRVSPAYPRRVVGSPVRSTVRSGQKWSDPDGYFRAQAE